MHVACVAFPFGCPSNTRANKKIAKIACGLQIPSYPGIYTHRDINIDAIKNLGYRHRMQVAYTPERVGYPPTTLRIARGAVEWAKKNNVTTLYIACASPHLWRCRRDLELAINEKAARYRINIKICFESRYPDNWFYKDCKRYKARFKWIWYTRETIIRLMPVWLYRKIAS